MDGARNTLLVLILAAGRIAFCGEAEATGNSGGGAFSTGTYRNLFVEAGHSQQEVTAKVDSAFRQLFHGDPNTQAVFYPAGKNANGDLAYLSDINSKDVRSEGM